jgi:ATP-dependent Zn protease
MASTMMKTVKDLFGKLQPTLPYLVMMGALTSTSLTGLLLVPVILEIAEWGYNMYKNRLNQCSLDVPLRNQFNRPNPFYKNITFVLEHHNLLDSIKKLRIEDISTTNQTHKFGSKSWQFENPVIEPGFGFKIPFEHNGFKIYIESIEIVQKNDQKIERTKNKYTISAENKSHLNAFISYATDLQLEYAKKKFNSNSDPVLYQLYKDDFTQNTINVKKTFRNIFLDSNIKKRLRSQLEAFINGKERYDELGIAYRTGYLLYGTPGNGKSSVIYAMAHEYRRDLYKINLKLCKESFLNQIKNVKPNSIVIFEDIDTCPITHCRTQEPESKEKEEKINDITLGDLLEVLDGYCYLNGCIIVMTTNHINKLDPALIRSGRIDHKIELTNASQEQITDIIQYFFHERLKESVSLNISVSELINSVIMPNLDNYEVVYDVLIKGNKFK